MKGKFQGQNEIVINASKERIWNVLIDGSQLSDWMPIVKHTTSGTESLDVVRSCEVDFEGRVGKVKERCVMLEEFDKIGWEMEEDTLGFSKMYSNFGFSFELETIALNSTRVINRGFSNPKNLFATLMNLFMMKRKSSQIRQRALLGLKRVSESS